VAAFAVGHIGIVAVTSLAFKTGLPVASKCRRKRYQLAHVVDVGGGKRGASIAIARSVLLQRGCARGEKQAERDCQNLRSLWPGFVRVSGMVVRTTFSNINGL
jgi:hypothetical protein